MPVRVEAVGKSLNFYDNVKNGSSTDKAATAYQVLIPTSALAVTDCLKKLSKTGRNSQPTASSQELAVFSFEKITSMTVTSYAVASQLRSSENPNGMLC
jgi:hypothetical protein